MLKDRYGNPVSTGSQAALAKYDDALELIRLYRGDPVGALDAALSDDPDFGAAWATRAGLLAQQTDKAYAEELVRSLRAGATARLNDRERAHLAAAFAWSEGRYYESAAKLAGIAHECPRDLLAVQFAHTSCFYLGMQHELRDWPLQALRAFRRGDDGYGPLLGMIAFGMEECGDYGGAEAIGREAVDIDPRDGWAVHAVAHVNEMRGDFEQGIPWLADNAGHWAPDSGFAYHNWWHLGLLHLDKGDVAQVLNLYDEKIRPDLTSSIMLELIDASAMLWRLKLEGVGLGNRFASLASAWERAAEDAFYVFNDLHALMAFLGAGRIADAERVLKAMRSAAAGGGDNGYMARMVGVPLAEAFLAFEVGRYGECIDKIVAVRGIAQRIGGSHAQRDILTLTALHAALKGGIRPAAEAFTAERLAHKPQSPWGSRLARQAQALDQKVAA